MAFFAIMKAISTVHVLKDPRFSSQMSTEVVTKCPYLTCLFKFFSKYGRKSYEVLLVNSK